MEHKKLFCCCDNESHLHAKKLQNKQQPLSLTHPLSLSLLQHTHTLGDFQTSIHSLSLAQTHSLTHIYTYTHTHTDSLSLKHTHTLYLYLTHTRALVAPVLSKAKIINTKPFLKKRFLQRELKLSPNDAES